MNIGRGEFVGLVDEVIEDFFGGNTGESLRNFGDGFRIAVAGNFDIVVMDLLRRVIAEHENFVGGTRNEEEVDFFTFVGVILAYAFDDGTGCLAGDHELIVFFAAASL